MLCRMKEECPLLGSLWEEAALLYGICVYLLGHVLLQLKLVARPNKLILE